MSATMADQNEARVRTTFDVPDRIRRALNASAARRGVSVGQVITELVEGHLQADLAYVEATPPPPRPKKR